MRVVVTDRKYPGEDVLGDVVEAAGGEYVFGGFESEDEMVEGCRDADVVVSASMPVTRRVIESMGDAELILKLTTGYDEVDVRAATEHGIPVSNVPVYCTWEVAEHAITLMSAASRQVVANDGAVRDGEWWDHRGRLRSVVGGTFGVVGFGRIGRAAAQLAQGLQMDVVGVDPYVPDDVFAAFDVRRVEFDELLAEADVLSAHVKLTTETRHLFGAEEFAAMKDSAVFVNTSRGPVVDVEALAEAVEAGELWGAGLDVFEEEPAADSPALATERIVCSPHHAGRTEEAKQRLVEYAREKVGRVVRGGHHGEIVNTELYALS